jgi:hypothetical protein
VEKKILGMLAAYKDDNAMIADEEMIETLRTSSMLYDKIADAMKEITKY